MGRLINGPNGPFIGKAGPYIKCEFHQPDIIRFSWDPSGTGELDEAMAIVHNPKKGCAMGPAYGNIRKSGGQDVIIHNDAGTTLHAYLGFIAADRSRLSDSVYLGKFEF